MLSPWEAPTAQTSSRIKRVLRWRRKGHIANSEALSVNSPLPGTWPCEVLTSLDSLISELLSPHFSKASGSLGSPLPGLEPGYSLQAVGCGNH